MGPLFSGVFVMLLAVAAVVLTFAVSRLFLRTRSALGFAAFFVAGAVVGTIGGMFLQLPFLAGKTTLVGSEPEIFLGVSFGTGLVSAVILGVLYLRISSARSRRGP